MTVEGAFESYIPQQYLEASGYHIALQLARKVAGEKRHPINEQYIKDLNYRVLFGLQSLKPGQYRTTPALIRDSLWIAPNWQTIPRFMKNFGAELEERSSRLRHSLFGIEFAVETMAFAHNELVKAQPFLDGNNRTAALLVDTLTKRAGMYYITDWGDKSGEYMKALKDTTASGNIGIFEGFLAKRLALRYEEKKERLMQFSTGDSLAKNEVLRDLDEHKKILDEIAASRKRGDVKLKSAFI